MKIEQIYTGCLAQGAYYIQDSGEAAIIDPLREIQPYLSRAEEDGVKIKYIFETHFHADFVSGHMDLSAKTGAPIVFGPTAEPGFKAHIAKDGEVFKIGQCQIKVLHTPGHTMESSCFLLLDPQGNQVALFSGDTLFLGDVGRPDLAQKAAHLSQEALAGLLYDSLQTKILPLSDQLMVYPAHGAGSACGKNMMKETQDTLGHQKQINYALNQPDKESFIKAVLEGLTAPPAYFPQNVAMNKLGYKPLEQILNEARRPLDPQEFKSQAQSGAVVILDTRTPAEFAVAHIPGALNIGLSGDFAPWVGALVGNVKQALLLVCQAGTELEVITRLSRVGFDRVLGYLQGGLEAWKLKGFEVDSVNRISAQRMQEQLKSNETVLDVRRPSEFSAKHVDAALNTPLDRIADWLEQLKAQSEPFYIHCAGGYRSMMAASILKAKGLHHFFEIDGGFAAISKTKIPIVEAVSNCANS